MATKAPNIKPEPKSEPKPESQTPVYPPGASALSGVSIDPVSEGAEVPSFLQGNMAEVDTSTPVLKGGQILDWKVGDVKIEPNNKGNGQNLRAVLKTVKDGAETLDGKTVGAGFPYFFTCSLTPTANYDEDAITKNVAKFVQGCGKTHLFPLSQYEGLIITCKTKVRPERKNKETGEVYPESTDLAFVPVGE